MIHRDSRQKLRTVVIASFLFHLALAGFSIAQDMPMQGMGCPPDCPRMNRGGGQQGEPMIMPGPQGMGMLPGRGEMMRSGMVGRGPMPRNRIPNEPWGQGFYGMLRRPEIQKELGITEEQRKKIEEIGFNASKSAIQQRAALQVLRLELQRLIRADTPDRAAIDKKIQEIAQAQSAELRARINSRLDIQNALTKEQREKIKNLGPNRMGPQRQPMVPGGMRRQPAPAKPNPQPTPPPQVQ